MLSVLFLRFCFHIRQKQLMMTMKRESTVPPSTLNTASEEGPSVVIWFRGPGLNLVGNWHAAKKFDEVHLVSCRSTKTYYQELVGKTIKGDMDGSTDRIA